MQQRIVWEMLGIGASALALSQVLSLGVPSVKDDAPGTTPPVASHAASAADLHQQAALLAENRRLQQELTKTKNELAVLKQNSRSRPAASAIKSNLHANSG